MRTQRSLRSQRLVAVALCVIVALASSAWYWRRPARIVVGVSDSVIVNSWNPVWLSVHVLNASGRSLPSRGVRYEWLSGGVVRLTTDGQVTCERPGDARLRVSRGSASAEIVVLCRPIQGFRFTAGARLVIGGPPRDIPLAAIGADGQPVAPIAARATVRDTAVASVDGLRAYPKSAGSTWVDVDVGDCLRSVIVEVAEAVSSTHDLTRPYQQFVEPSVRLEAGATHRWPIAPGQYELWLRSPSPWGSELRLETTESSCARIPDDGELLLCVAREGASVSVSRVRRSTRNPPASELLITRLEEPTSNRVTTARYVSRPPHSWKADCFFSAGR